MIKKVIYKIITLMILIIILNAMLNFNISKADTISSADLYSIEQFNNLLTYNGIPITCTFVVYQSGGVEYPAYCMDKNLPGVGENGAYSVDTSSLITNVLLWNVITNGYPYKTYQELGCDNAEQAYLATKQAAYCIVCGNDPNGYTPISTEGQNCLNALCTILNNAYASSAVKVSSDITITQTDAKWNVDSINPKYVSMTFTADAAGPMNTYSINITGTLPDGTLVTDESNQAKSTFNKGENFKILIPIQNLAQDGNFNINAAGAVATKPVLYGRAPSSSLQDYALTGAMYEEGSGSLKTYYTKNSTEITILKQASDTKDPLAGVQFELLDNNQNVIYTSLVTNDQGEVSIDNLLPGTYYVKETKALEGYALYDKLIPVNVDLNEISKVIVDNSEEDVKIDNSIAVSTQEVGAKSSTHTVTLPKTGY